MKQNKLVLCWLICLSVVFILAWTNTLKTSTPGATDDPREADDRMREIKGAFVERLDVDHYWTASATSTYDAADTGKHEFITLIDMASDPTAAAGYAHIYMKGDELFYQDDTDTTLMLTKDGAIEWESINDVNNSTYILSVDTAGTGTANLIMADANDLATLPDGAVLAAETQSIDGDRTIADKGYIDGVITANTTMVPAVSGEGTGYAGEESITLTNGFIMKTGYTARTGNTTTVTFDTAFPNAIVSAMVTLYRTADGNAYEPVLRTLSTTTLTIYHDSSATGYYWFAIGH